MEKVFVLTELYTFNFDTDFRVSIYADREKAIGAFNDRVKREEKDSWIATIPEDELVVNYSNENGRLEYNAYRDGYAAENETNIIVTEKEVW